jgi:hypothetical protein
MGKFSNFQDVLNFKIASKTQPGSITKQDVIDTLNVGAGYPGGNNDTSWIRITSGSAYQCPPGKFTVYIDFPSVVVGDFNLTFPPDPEDNQVFTLVFGGTIKRQDEDGTQYADSFVLQGRMYCLPALGQTIYRTLSYRWAFGDPEFQSSDTFKWYYRKDSSKWLDKP